MRSVVALVTAGVVYLLGGHGCDVTVVVEGIGAVSVTFGGGGEG